MCQQKLCSLFVKTARKFKITFHSCKNSLNFRAVLTSNEHSLFAPPKLYTATTMTMATDFMMNAGGTLRVVKVATALFIAATALCVFYSGSEDHESGMPRKSFPRTFPKFRRGTYKLVHTIKGIRGQNEGCSQLFC
jgi:hypothetical protein